MDECISQRLKRLLLRGKKVKFTYNVSHQDQQRYSHKEGETEYQLSLETNCSREKGD